VKRDKLRARYQNTEGELALGHLSLHAKRGNGGEPQRGALRILCAARDSVNGFYGGFSDARRFIFFR
jgi:hypothetical protein